MTATVLSRAGTPRRGSLRRRRRVSNDLRGGLLVTAVVVLGHALVLAANRRFSYQDDAQSYFLPMWRDLGVRLRAGELPVLSPEQWMAGHYAFESQIGLWNPVQLAINLVAPSVDRLAVLAAAVTLGFAVLLGTGVYRVALAHGAAHRWAVVVGSAAPFAGWTLWYDTASWVIALMCTAYVAHAWASLHRHVHGLAGPLPAFAWLYLDLSTGYPYGAVAAGVVTLCVLVGAAAARLRVRAMVLTAATALSAVACASIAFLPGFSAYAVSFRSANVGTFANDGGLVVPWSEALLGGVPTYLPQVVGFTGNEQVPSTFLAWFVLPALPFLRWSVLPTLGRALAGPLTLALLMVVAASTPSLSGPLRWPGRYVVYLGLAVLVVLAVLATAGLATDHWRRRAGIALLLVGLVSLRAASITAPRLSPVEEFTAPQLGSGHLVGAALLVLLGAVALALHRWRGEALVAAVALAGVPLVLGYQLSLFPENTSWQEYHLPSDAAIADATFPERPGSTLQLGDVTALLPEFRRGADDAWTTLTTANYARSLGRDYVNAYTPVGYRAFSDLLCMDFRGNTCPAAKDRLFAPQPQTLARPVDLMALDRIVLQRAQFPTVHDEVPPRGWRRASVDELTVVWERTGAPGPGPGGITWTDDVQVGDVEEQTDLTWRGTVRSDGGGRVAFSRLAWPGYEVTLDGEPLPPVTLFGGFLAVDVPDGGGELVLRYEVPGWRLGGVLAAVGLVSVLGVAVLSRRRGAHHWA